MRQKSLCLLKYLPAWICNSKYLIEMCVGLVYSGIWRSGNPVIVTKQLYHDKCKSGKAGNAGKLFKYKQNYETEYKYNKLPIRTKSVS